MPPPTSIQLLHRAHRPQCSRQRAVLAHVRQGRARHRSQPLRARKMSSTMPVGEPSAARGAPALEARGPGGAPALEARDDPVLETLGALLCDGVILPFLSSFGRRSVLGDENPTPSLGLFPCASISTAWRDAVYDAARREARRLIAASPMSDCFDARGVQEDGIRQWEERFRRRGFGATGGDGDGSSGDESDWETVDSHEREQKCCGGRRGVVLPSHARALLAVARGSNAPRDGYAKTAANTFSSFLDWRMVPKTRVERNWGRRAKPYRAGRQRRRDLGYTNQGRLLRFGCQIGGRLLRQRLGTALRRPPIVESAKTGRGVRRRAVRVAEPGRRPFLLLERPYVRVPLPGPKILRGACG